jgi:hypothetical protein
MTFGRRQWWFGLVLPLVSVIASGCREGHPPPAHNRNLGDDTVLLLPVRSSRVDPDLKGGTAEWYDFPEFGAEREATGDEPTGEGSGEIEAEIRELISEYNEVVAERTLDELLEYHVDEQQDAITALYEAKFATMDKVAEVKAAFEERLPDAEDRVADEFAELEHAAGVNLVVESLTVVNDDEITGNLAAGSTTPTCRFVVIDEDWYIEFPRLPDFAQLKPLLDGVTTAGDEWLQALQSGDRPAEEVLDEVGEFVRTMTTARGATDEDVGPDEADPTGADEEQD